MDATKHGLSGYRVALFGYPLGHTVSPAMHHAAAAALGVRMSYEPWQVAASALPAGVQQLRSPSWLGANVTLPHKPAMLTLVDSVSPLVQRIGALNTVYKRDGVLHGENTDAPALMACLVEQLAFQPAEESVLVLGAGGAARAALVALKDSGVASISLWNRGAERAQALLHDLALADGVEGPDRCGIALLDPATLMSSLRRATLVVNATSVGLDGASSPLPALDLAPGARVYDLVYGLDGTPLVREARRNGYAAVDGLWMLVYQAATAFELWTGLRPPERTMYEAAVASLTQRAAAAMSVTESS